MIVTAIAVTQCGAATIVAAIAVLLRLSQLLRCYGRHCYRGATPIVTDIALLWSSLLSRRCYDRHCYCGAATTVTAIAVLL